MNYLALDKIIQEALIEDIPSEDISTFALVSKDNKSTVDLIAKENGVIAGIDVFKRVFTLLGDVEVNSLKNDGDTVEAKTLIATITGNTRNILAGERTALNLLQRLSGIATLTRKYCIKVSGTKAQVVDTRKTTPNLRLLEKYAVRIGGGMNHRFNLSDGIMLKDNHIAAAGGINEAVKRVRATSSFVRKIEVEVENLEMVKEAIDAKADIIMLDNMSLDMMRQAVELIGDSAIIEASGNVNLNTIEDIAKTGVDIISVGNLTHSAPILDLSMKNLRNI